MARLVGSILSAANTGSELIVDAHVVARLIEKGGGVALTGDADDLVRLAATYRNLTVGGLP